MITVNALKRMTFCAVMLAAAIVLAAGFGSTQAYAAEEKIDIGNDANIICLTSYVYPDSSGNMKGEIRLADISDQDNVYILSDTADVDFSVQQDGKVKASAKENSARYTGEYTCEPAFTGLSAPSVYNNIWEYMPVNDYDGWSDYALISYKNSSSKTVKITQLDEYLSEHKDGNVYHILPGAFYGLPSLTKVDLDEADYEPYMIVNCPQLSSVRMVLDEFTAPSMDPDDIKPVHLGNIKAENLEDNIPVNKIILTVNKDANWYFDDNDRYPVILKMREYCRIYSRYYIMETNSKVFNYGDWMFSATLDSDNKPSSFTIISYRETAPQDVKQLTLPASVKYDKKTYSADEYYFDLGTNIISDLPYLEELYTGEYQLMAPLVKNCPKLKAIHSDFRSDPEDDEYFIWQDNCDNMEYVEDFQPLVNGDLDNTLLLDVSEDFVWTVYRHKTNEKGEYIDSEGNVVEDPYDADDVELTYKLSDYCSLFGYAFKGETSLDEARLRINAHNSITAIADSEPLNLSVWMSSDPSSYDDEDAEWYPASDVFDLTVSDWAISFDEDDEDLSQYVTLNKTKETVTVSPQLPRSGAVRVSCKVKEKGKTDAEAVAVSSELYLEPRFFVNSFDSKYLLIGEDKVKIIPFMMNKYSDEEAGKSYAGEAGDEYCDYDEHSPQIIYSGKEEDIPEGECFHPSKGVAGEISLERAANGKDPADVAELLSAAEGEPLYLLKAKDGAAERDRFIVKASFTYKGVVYDLSREMMISAGHELSREDAKLIPEEGNLVIGVFTDSYSANLANTIAEMYPDFANRVEVVEMDENEWEDAASAYSDYMQGISDYMFDEDSPEAYPDIIIWPSYMLKGQYGGAAAGAFEDNGINLPGNDYHRYGALRALEKSGNKTYAAATSINPGGFIYNKSVAKAVLGSDDPETVQNAVGSWEAFVDLMGVLSSGERKDGDAIRIRNHDDAGYFLLSSADYLNEAVTQSRGILAAGGETIDLDDTAIDYLTICRKLCDANMIGSDSDLVSNKAFGRFVTEEEVLGNEEMSAMLNEGTLGIVRGPSSFTGEGTELATITTAGSEVRSSFVSLFLKLMLTDTAAMDLAYEYDEGNGYQGSIFANNSAWQASLDRPAEGKRVRSLWNEVIKSMAVSQSDPISEYVQSYIGDKWSTDHDVKLSAIKSELADANLYLPELIPVSKKTYGAGWSERHYPVNGGTAYTSRFDLTDVGDDAQTARFNKFAAAGVSVGDGPETFFYSLTEAVKAANELDGATVRLYKDMAYSGGSFIVNSIELDLNAKTISTSGKTDKAPLFKVNNNGIFKIKSSSTVSRGGAVSAVTRDAAADASEGKLDLALGNKDSFSGHILLDQNGREDALKLSGGSYDDTAAKDIIAFLGRKAYAEAYGAGSNRATFSFAASLLNGELVNEENRCEAANLCVLADGYSYSPAAAVPEALEKSCFRLGTAEAMPAEEAVAGLTENAMHEYRKSSKNTLTRAVGDAEQKLSSDIYVVSAAGDGSDVDSAHKWITAEQKKALEDALEAAKALDGNAAASLDEINAASFSVTRAASAYENAPAGHIPADSGGNGGSGEAGGGNNEQAAASSASAVSAEIEDLPAVKITGAKKGKKSLTVKWKKPKGKDLGKIAKIQVQYSLSKDFSSADTKIKNAGKKKTSLRISKLKSKKKYYVRVRAYNKYGGKIHVSKWSKKKAVKVQ